MLLKIILWHVLGLCQTLDVQTTAEKWRSEYPEYKETSDRFAKGYLSELQKSPEGKALVQLAEKGCPDNMTADECTTLRMNLLQKISNNKNFQTLMDQHYQNLNDFVQRHPATQQDIQKDMRESFKPKE